MRGSCGEDYNPAQVHSLLLAVQFLTVFPLLSSRQPRPEAFGGAVGCFPLVGVLLAVLAVAVDTAARQLWPPAVAAAVVLASLVVVTGALHLDGFLDTCDGLFLWNPEKRLPAMRDSRVGSFAVAGGLALYALKLTALGSAAGPARLAALALTPVAGRLGLSLAVVLFPYARASGLGNAFKDQARPRHLLIAGASALAVASAFGIAGVVTLVTAPAVSWLLATYVSNRLSGLTGDSYGFICESVETFTLLLIIAIPAPYFVWLAPA